MFFVVLVDVWEYWPRRCTLVVYERGQKGCLPDNVVLWAEQMGYVRRIDSE